MSQGGRWSPLRWLGLGASHHVDYLAPEFEAAAQRAVEALHPRSMRLRVEERIDETPTCHTLRFARTDGPIPPFRPGQYLSLEVEVGGVRTSRPFSISSPPGVDHLDLTIRREVPGFVSPYLVDEVGVGWETTSTGPLGSFHFEPLIDQGRIVMIAGGSGITPFMSQLHHWSRVGFPRQVTLLYGSRRDDDVIFGAQLAALSARHAELSYELVVSEPTERYAGRRGFIDRELLASTLGSDTSPTFLMCGPEAMQRHVLAQLERLGAPLHKVRIESFGAPRDVRTLAGWPQDVHPEDRFDVRIGEDEVITAVAGETLLSALERNQVPIVAECRTGECAHCRVRIESGSTISAERSGVRESDRQRGYVHACVCFPTSHLQVSFDH